MAARTPGDLRNSIDKAFGSLKGIPGWVAVDKPDRTFKTSSYNGLVQDWKKGKNTDVYLFISDNNGWFKGTIPQIQDMYQLWNNSNISKDQIEANSINYSNYQTADNVEYLKGIRERRKTPKVTFNVEQIAEFKDAIKNIGSGRVFNRNGQEVGTVATISKERRSAKASVARTRKNTVDRFIGEYKKNDGRYFDVSGFPVSFKSLTNLPSSGKYVTMPGDGGLEGWRLISSNWGGLEAALSLFGGFSDPELKALGVRLEPEFKALRSKAIGDNNRGKIVSPVQRPSSSRSTPAPASTTRLAPPPPSTTRLSASPSLPAPTQSKARTGLLPPPRAGTMKTTRT